MSRRRKLFFSTCVVASAFAVVLAAFLGLAALEAHSKLAFKCVTVPLFVGVVGTLFTWMFYDLFPWEDDR